MADLNTLRSRLNEAEEARHALAMGRRVVEVWRDGRRVTFQQSNKGDLDSYISALEDAIREADANSSRPRRRFIGVNFG